MDSPFPARQQLETDTVGISFDALNLWASKRGLAEKRLNIAVFTGVFGLLDNHLYSIIRQKRLQALIS